jgi:3-oxoacyl-[acyl-carrier-protein] synthase-3
MTSKAYINDIAGFLPNAPVGNEDIEQVLGMVGGKPSRSRRITLRSNGIESRYYAIDPKTGHFTHTNAQLAAEAVRALWTRSGLAPEAMEVLCCGTSGPDQIKPGHAHMVHGELKAPSCEVASFAGVCTSGTAALKYAWMSIAAGQARHAIATGSELASSFMHARNFESEIENRLSELEKRPELAFEKDFLRWMLSDGAGAVLLASMPNSGRRSLRIDASAQRTYHAGYGRTRPAGNRRQAWTHAGRRHLVPAALFVGIFPATPARGHEALRFRNRRRPLVLESVPQG